MTTIDESTNIFVNYVKDGILNTDALKAAVMVGKDAEAALKKLEKEGFKI